MSDVDLNLPDSGFSLVELVEAYDRQATSDQQAERQKDGSVAAACDAARESMLALACDLLRLDGFGVAHVSAPRRDADDLSGDGSLTGCVRARDLTVYLKVTWSLSDDLCARIESAVAGIERQTIGAFAEAPIPVEEGVVRRETFHRVLRELAWHVSLSGQQRPPTAERPQLSAFTRTLVRMFATSG